jgi:hypothetical protein
VLTPWQIALRVLAIVPFAVASWFWGGFEAALAAVAGGVFGLTTRMQDHSKPSDT